MLKMGQVLRFCLKIISENNTQKAEEFLNTNDCCCFSSKKEKICSPTNCRQPIFKYKNTKITLRAISPFPLCFQKTCTADT